MESDPSSRPQPRCPLPTECSCIHMAGHLSMGGEGGAVPALGIGRGECDGWQPRCNAGSRDVVEEGTGNAAVAAPWFQQALSRPRWPGPRRNDRASPEMNCIVMHSQRRHDVPAHGGVLACSGHDVPAHRAAGFRATRPGGGGSFPGVHRTALILHKHARPCGGALTALLRWASASIDDHYGPTPLPCR